jgi:hypothetical protein
VRFQRNGADVTLITLAMDVDPQGPVQQVGDALGILDRQVEGDLERFKEFIESRSVPTGAWRGTVEDASPR